MNTSSQPPQDPTDQLDPAFFSTVNAFIDLANSQGRTHGPKRISAAVLYAAARYNVHAYLGQGVDVASTRAEFLAYMQDLYRRMLEEHIEALAAERGIALGDAPQAATTDEPPPGAPV